MNWQLAEDIPSFAVQRLLRTVRSDTAEAYSASATHGITGYGEMMACCHENSSQCSVWKSHITMPATRAIRYLLRQMPSIDWTVSFQQRQTAHYWIERVIHHRLYELTWFACFHPNGLRSGFALALRFWLGNTCERCSHPRAAAERMIGPYTAMQQEMFHWLLQSCCGTGN